MIPELSNGAVVSLQFTGFLNVAICLMKKMKDLQGHNQINFILNKIAEVQRDSDRSGGATSLATKLFPKSFGQP